MNRRSGIRERQSGAAFIVVLLLLVVVTLLGLASMRDAIMQERMAAYTVARGFAFQAAEAAMREAEDFARGKPDIPDAGCSNGVCTSPGGGQPLYESQANFWETVGNYRAASKAVNGITPRYSLEGFGTKTSTGAGGGECLGENCGPAAAGDASVYRITVRSRAANGTEVMLQSLYQAP